MEIVSILAGCESDGGDASVKAHWLEPSLCVYFKCMCTFSIQLIVCAQVFRDGAQRCLPFPLILVPKNKMEQWTDGGMGMWAHLC